MNFGEIRVSDINKSILTFDSYYNLYCKRKNEEELEESLKEALSPYLDVLIGEKLLYQASRDINRFLNDLLNKGLITTTKDEVLFIRKKD